MNNIETDRLIIRPFVLADLDAVHRLLDHDLRWAGRPLSCQERQHRLRYQIDRTSDAANSLYGDRAIVMRTSGEVIGMVHFQSRVVTPDEKKAVGLAIAGPDAFSTIELDIGYALATVHQRRGYATESAEAMIEYVFGSLRLGRIFADTGRGNLRSVALLKRLNMKIVPCPRPGWPDRMLACLINRDAM